MLIHFEPIKCNLKFNLGAVPTFPNTFTIWSIDFKIIRSIYKFKNIYFLKKKLNIIILLALNNNIIFRLRIKYNIIKIKNNTYDLLFVYM